MLPLMADPVDAFGETHPLECAHRFRLAPGVGAHIGRSQRITGEVVFQVGQEQFLVLLFMVQPELDNRQPGDGSIVLQTLQQGGHLLVDKGAIAIDLLHGWT